ncbi:MAG TPA: hypothetical protein VM889_13360 [Candidatus Thermoplasmatota archaeon]|nr:hypothetical protein [Candidatus Thermoplasmatota archaeon]
MRSWGGGRWPRLRAAYWHFVRNLAEATHAVVPADAHGRLDRLRTWWRAILTAEDRSTPASIALAPEDVLQWTSRPDAYRSRPPDELAGAAVASESRALLQWLAECAFFADVAAEIQVIEARADPATTATPAIQEAIADGGGTP